MRFFWSRRRMDDDAAEELRHHLELLTERYISNGMTPEAARDAAARQLGNVTRVREDIHELNGVRWLDNLARDARYGCRQIARHPLFALVVIVTMGLGIGANTAILSVAYSVLVKPLPYASPDEIYSVNIVVPERREQIPSLPATVQVFLSWQKDATAFSSITAMTPWEASVTGDGEPEYLGGARVAANFFSFLGLPVAVGRSFLDEESTPGKDRVVVISDGVWRRRYGADPSVIGRTISINGEPFQIVGVAAPSLLVPTATQLNAVIPFAARVDIWKPIAPTAATLNNESWDHGVLVRANRAALARGQQQLLDLLTQKVREDMPQLKTDPIIEMVPIRDVYAAKLRVPLLLIAAAAALLLITACASIANVFLARGASRAGEVAMRVALGAGRGRIAAQLLTETLLLSLAGGAIGAVLASYGTTLLSRLAPAELRALSSVAINTPFLLCALAVTIVTGLACGIVPIVQSSRRDPMSELRDARIAPAGVTRTRQLLVSIEMALATVLLASGALLLHSFLNVMNGDRGYDVDGVLTADLSLFGDRYKAPDARGAFYTELVDAVRALPGVTAAGAINNLPAVSASDGPSRAILLPEDTDAGAVMLKRPVAMIRAVTPGYFAASGATLRAGRTFTGAEQQLVCIVSESLANRLWPGASVGDVIGRQLRQGGNLSTPLVEVIGVVAEARPGGLDREPTAALYRPYGQWPSGYMSLVARTSGDPLALVPSVKAQIRRLDPDMPIASIRTMREIVSSAVAQRRLQMMLTALFAIVALLVGVVGVYGVTNYAVATRTRDIGVRLALGADRITVMRWALALGIRPVLIGLGVGIAGAIAAASVFRAMLFGIDAFDPVSLAAVVVVLVATSAMACYVPARRAASIDPIAALRHD